MPTEGQIKLVYYGMKFVKAWFMANLDEIATEWQSGPVIYEKVKETILKGQKTNLKGVYQDKPFGFEFYVDNNNVYMNATDYDSKVVFFGSKLENDDFTHEMFISSFSVAMNSHYGFKKGK